MARQTVLVAAVLVLAAAAAAALDLEHAGSVEQVTHKRHSWTRRTVSRAEAPLARDAMAALAKHAPEKPVKDPLDAAYNHGRGMPHSHKPKQAQPLPARVNSPRHLAEQEEQRAQRAYIEEDLELLEKKKGRDLHEFQARERRLRSMPTPTPHRCGTKTAPDAGDRERHQLEQQNRVEAHERRLARMMRNMPHGRSLARRLNSLSNATVYDTPMCGVTVCDNPDVILGYASDPAPVQHLLKMTIVNVAEDDNSNPLVDAATVAEALNVMNEGFAGTHITWTATEVVIKDSSLRHKAVVIDCPLAWVGDNYCDSSCDVPETGNDGGDCSNSGACTTRGDGVCQAECNNVDNNYDNGDCCTAANHADCVDPSAPFELRKWTNDWEYKMSFGLSNDDTMNIYPTNWLSDSLIGYATFPWDFATHTISGGVMMKDTWMHSPVLVHEAGHMLGLWHIFHGLEEKDCSDAACMETHHTMSLMDNGDLCADTPSTQRSGAYESQAGGACVNPVVETNECDWRMGQNMTGFANYMSYSDDPCVNHFSPQQAARMNCYIDYVLRKWGDEEGLPSRIPTAPSLKYIDGDVAIVWKHPMNMGLGVSNNGKFVCGVANSASGVGVGATTGCDENGQPIMLATSVTSNHKGGHECRESSNLMLLPSSNECYADCGSWTWNPASDSGSPVITASFQAPDGSDLLPTVFGDPGMPAELLIWSVEGHDPAMLVELLDQSGAVAATFNVSVESCVDGQALTPHRIPLLAADAGVQDTAVSVSAVVLRPSGSFVSLTTIGIVGVADGECSGCTAPEFVITRTPAWSDGVERVTTLAMMVDDEMTTGTTYTYSVQTQGQTARSPPSAELVHEAGAGFCGDGLVQSDDGEECDDSNEDDKDGCTRDCKVLDGFSCSGEPSQCGWSCGDGICEDHEGCDCWQDCACESDQWVTGYEETCNWHYCDDNNGIFGPPERSDCDFHLDGTLLYAEDFGDGEAPFTLTVTFDDPVVVDEVLMYVGYDSDENVSLELWSTNGDFVPVGHMSVACHPHHGALLPSRHVLQYGCNGMPEPFVSQGLRFNFTYDYLGIDAIKVRTHHELPENVPSCTYPGIPNLRLFPNMVVSDVCEPDAGDNCDMPFARIGGEQFWIRPSIDPDELAITDEEPVCELSPQ